MKQRLKACKPSSKNARHAGTKNDSANRRCGHSSNFFRARSALWSAAGRRHFRLDRVNTPTVHPLTNAVTFTAKDVAALSRGELVGDPTLKITGAASLGEATMGEISFFANRKYIGLLRKTRASAVFVPPDFAEPLAAAQVRVSNPTNAFEQVVLKFAPKPITFEPGIHPSAIIGSSVQLGERVSIQPHAVIEDGSQIGDDTIIGAGSYIGHEAIIGSACLIYPLVTIRERSRIGSRVIIHSGAVIGADGFGFEVVDGRQQKIQQLGIVQIDDDVEIGANTTVDRARFGRTWIQQGVKIDNLVQIAHNVVIGKNSVIVAQTGISGST